MGYNVLLICLAVHVKMETRLRKDLSTNFSDKILKLSVNLMSLPIGIYRTANISRPAGSFHSWSNRAFSRSMELAKMG